MKLATAIRLGAMLKPQGFGSSEYPDKTCALQAACEAVGIRPMGIQSFLDINDAWAWGVSGTFECPECHAEYYSVSGLIAFCLNDRHEWSRERIADHIESIEPSEILPAEPVSQAVAR